MKRTLQCRMKGYIQPFERILAVQELRQLSDSEPKPLRGSTTLYEIQTKVPVERLQEHLAYWEAVIGSKTTLTIQSLREASANVVRNGVAPKEIRELVTTQSALSLPNRRALRYGTHGIHEYRGKFFPQLVRSLLNISSIGERGIVADPMCGSGTCVTEAILSRRRGLGLDMNPLSVLMARTKCSLLTVKPETLIRRYEQVRSDLMRPAAKNKWIGSSYFESLPVEDQKYLKNWFPEQVLADLDQIARAVTSIREESIRDFMRLALSNILRGVSWQKEDDLRVRKEVRIDADLDPIRNFLEELGRSVRIVLAFLYQGSKACLGEFTIQEGDAREIRSIWPDLQGCVDVIITSPPYATALPYLDTDRLSLCYLGLLPRSEHRKLDQGMIGNREISEKTRVHYWTSFEQSTSALPASVVRLIKQVDQLNSKIEVGFRRRNLPALLSKYFLDMRDVLSGMKALLKPRHRAYVVVGSNHTMAGGDRVDIDTPTLLSELAEIAGLRTEERIPMDMLVSRDIFRKNAGASEEVLCLRAR